MAKNILTPDFSYHMAEQFYESFSEEANTIYYVTASKPTPFENDLIPPEPDVSLSGGFLSVYNSMLFGKHVTPEDVSFMVKKNMWTAGEIYDMYDDKDPDLDSKKFFVISKEPNNVYSIFKCIYNGKLVMGDEVYIPPSTDQPLSTETSAEDEYYRTADGYVWKLMGIVSDTEFDKFSTDKYAPIKLDDDVIYHAKDGAINFILIDNPGSSYNAYAFGTVKQAAVAGNTKIFSLQTDETKDILTFDCIFTTGSVFVENHNTTNKKKIFFKLQNGSNWTNSGNVVSGELYYQKNTIVRITLDSSIRFNTKVVSLFQTDNNTANGVIIAQSTIEDMRRDLIPNLSSNTDFYKNSSFYIRNGKGAGQLRNITEYIVTGNERRVLIDEPFDILPDVTSKFEISPRVMITGDGTGTNGINHASAVAIMNESSNSIHSIEMVDVGKGYTYSDITIVSNTGYVDISTELSIQANNASARAIISPIGGHGSHPYKELGAKNIGISTKFSSSLNTKIPTQNDYRTISLIRNPLFYRLGLGISINALNFIDGETIIQLSDGAYGEVHNRQGTTLTLKNIRGFFRSGETISTVRAVNNVEAVINTLDNNFDAVDQRLKLAVEVTNQGPQGTGFVLDEEVYQSDTNATGIVASVSTNRIDLVDVKGIWMVSDDATSVIADMIGVTSGATAKITGKVEGELTKYSGDILYIENASPIQRSETQSEQIKIVINF